MPIPARPTAATSRAPSHAARSNRRRHERGGHARDRRTPPRRPRCHGGGQDGRGPMTAGNNKWIGQSVKRLEGPPPVNGHGRFAADLSLPPQLPMRIGRLTHTHGRIVAVDTSAARALPGVVAVWTAGDIADVPPIDFREGRIPPLEPYRQPVLATGTVRYVGEPVAAVFADDPYVAEDAADLVSLA